MWEGQWVNASRDVLFLIEADSDFEIIKFVGCFLALKRIADLRAGAKMYKGLIKLKSDLLTGKWEVVAD